ncbi:MAG: hypothetical protein HWE13_05625 [Gammaproteobacteria bacterium]|nr:hypothetical protein [Gammaproteobacteria bacterium]
MLRAIFKAVKAGTTLMMVLMTFLLSGCFPSYYNYHEPITEKTVVKPEQGIVVARIIDAGRGFPPFNQLTINPENVQQSDKIKPDRLLSMVEEVDGVAIFASAIKPGNYAMNDISAYLISGDYSYWRGVPIDAQFGTFTVKPGEVTDLGTLIYYPKPKEDKFMHSVVRIPTENLEQLLARFFPFYKFDPSKVNTWLDDQRDDERFELYANIVQNPVVFSGPVTAPDGALYFLAKLGAIVRRNTFGEWELDAVDTNYQLNSVAESNNGDLVVAGPEGVLYVKPQGDEWHDISFDLPVNVLKVYFSPKGELDILVADEYQLQVLRTSGNLTSPNWTEVNNYTYTDKWKVSAETAGDKKNRKAKYITGAYVFDEGGRDLLAVSYANRRGRSGDTEIYQVDLSSWNILAGPLETKWEVTFQAGAVKLALEKLGFWSGNWRRDYFKYDPKTQDWYEMTTEIFKCGEKIVRPDFVCDIEGKKTNGDWINFKSTPWFKNDLEGVGIVTLSDVDFWTGKRSSETLILYTEDGGRVWLDSGNKIPKPYCTDIVGEVKDKIVLYCNGATGDFYESSDMGKTWKHVRQQGNF